MRVHQRDAATNDNSREAQYVLMPMRPSPRMTPRVVIPLPRTMAGTSPACAAATVAVVPSEILALVVIVTIKHTHTPPLGESLIFKSAFFIIATQLLELQEVILFLSSGSAFARKKSLLIIMFDGNIIGRKETSYAQVCRHQEL